MKRAYFRGLALLIIAQMMVGLNIVYTKTLVSDVPIFLLLAARFSMAAIVLLPLHWLTKERAIPLRTHFSRLEKKDWVMMTLQGLCAGFLFNLLMLLGLKLTDANAAGIITSALPAIIVLLSVLFFKEKLTAKKSGCLFFATLGLLTLAYYKFQRLGISHSFWGDMVVLLALVPEATYYLLCQIYTSKLPVFLLTSYLNGICALLFFIILACMPWPSLAYASHIWLIILLLGVSSGLFYVLWYFGSRHVDMVLASLTTAIMPIATVIFAFLILGEQLSGAQFAGMTLVIFSIAIYAKR